jgi:hypothetical protein
MLRRTPAFRDASSAKLVRQCPLASGGAVWVMVWVQTPSLSEDQANSSNKELSRADSVSAIIAGADEVHELTSRVSLREIDSTVHLGRRPLIRRSWHFSDIEAARSNVAFGLLSDVSGKVLTPPKMCSSKKT